METIANELFDEAIKKLDQANQELYRPEEDVVTFLVCQNAHLAIENFLKGFLLQNNKEVPNNMTIESLYEQCKTINKNFEEIDLSGFDCKSDQADSRYCNSTTKVSRCFDVAHSLDSFLKRENIISL